MAHSASKRRANTLLAVVAVVCGGIVGAERERREKPAGLRTLILVCLGSTLFTIASFIFNTATDDSGRVAGRLSLGSVFSVQARSCTDAGS